MRNIALTLEYDGTDFAGSQYQSDVRTVQGELEGAWRRLTGKTVRWSFAGRTDAGVHARGQIANARTETQHDLQTIQRGLNALLARDVAVREAREVPSEFHARFSAWRRDYRYVVLNEPWPAPLLRERALHVPESLDVASMDRAVGLLRGSHDFAAFGAAVSGSTVRLCYAASCRSGEYDGRRIVTIEIAANGFLRHMVRTVVGTLLLVGRGRLPASDMGEILARRDRAAAGPAAAPHGLYLETVWYAGDNVTAVESGDKE
jgi:tRNA pseudouridine38-40 synthase